MGVDVFSGCTSLVSVTVGTGITSIGAGTFANCSSLTGIKYNGTETQWNAIEKASGWDTGAGSYTVTYNYTCITHNLTHHPRVEAKCNATGSIEYWFCSDCGMFFTDSTATTEATSIVIKADCVYVNSLCRWCGKTERYSEGLSYTLSDDKTYYIVSGIGTCNDTDIIIPYTYNSKPIKSIAARAFYGNPKITGVTFGGNVETIGTYAFGYCRGLTSVTLGTGITAIEEYAFEGCNKLVEVINKSSLSIVKGDQSNGLIGKWAFEVHTGGSKVTNKDGFLFYITGGGTIYLLGYTGTNTEIVFPDDYNGQNYRIYRYAFAERTDITSITLSLGVTAIEYRAFWKCTGLTTINYKGTETQWNAISKENGWDTGAGSYTVTCNYTDN